jgi:prevent-host-death family protein
MLKAHLSRYLDSVKSGEEVIVTERGRPVARLSGLDAQGSPTGRVAMLIREGRMRGPSAGGSRMPTLQPIPTDPTGRSVELLMQERAEGR